MDRSNIISLAAPLALLLGATALTTTASAQDTVKLRNGTTESGRVESEDYDALHFKAKKGKEERSLRLAWNEVADVTFGGVPEYTQAMGQLGAGNVGAALPRLQTVIANANLRKEIRPAAMFQLGAGQLRAGQFEAAATTLGELVKTSPKSRYVLMATSAIVDCYLALGNLEGGAAAVEAAATAAGSGGVGSEVVAAFDYFRGMLLEAKKDLASARNKYQNATRAGAAAGQIAALAKLGVGRCDKADGKVEDARTAYRAIVEQAQDNEVLAGAWNGLADITLDEGIKAKNAEKVENALLMYLRGVAEYGPAPGEGTREYQRSLAGSAEAFKQLSDLATDEAVKKQQAARSRQRLEQLRKEFPHSAFLPK